jgi:hypothetical protein
MFVDEDKYISRRLDVALKVLAAVVFVVFAVGAAIRFSSHGPTDVGAWGLCVLTALSLWSILTSNKALRVMLVGFLAMFGA